MSRIGPNADRGHKAKLFEQISFSDQGGLGEYDLA